MRKSIAVLQSIAPMWLSDEIWFRFLPHVLTRDPVNLRRSASSGKSACCGAMLKPGPVHKCVGPLVATFKVAGSVWNEFNLGGSMQAQLDIGTLMALVTMAALLIDRVASGILLLLSLSKRFPDPSTGRPEQRA